MLFTRIASCRGEKKRNRKGRSGSRPARKRARHSQPAARGSSRKSKVLADARLQFSPQQIFSGAGIEYSCLRARTKTSSSDCETSFALFGRSRNEFPVCRKRWQGYGLAGSKKTPTPSKRAAPARANESPDTLEDLSRDWAKFSNWVVGTSRENFFCPKAHRLVRGPMSFLFSRTFYCSR